MKKESNIIRIIIFILSPFLSLPFIIHGISNQKKSAVFLLVCFIGLLSYFFIPSVSNDKSYYYYLYELFTTIDFNGFVNDFLLTKPDFLFYYTIYTFSFFKIPFNILSFLFAAISVGLWYKGFYKTIYNHSKTISNKTYLVFIFLILFSFSPPSLFSGMRFILGGSLVFYGLSIALHKGKVFSKGLMFVLLGMVTHFSLIVYLPLYFLLIIFRNKHRLFFLIFIASFAFTLIPRSFFLDILLDFNLSSALENKTQSYLGEKDFLENSISVGNINNSIMIALRFLWVFISFYYIFFRRKIQSIYKNGFLLMMAVSNVFFSAPNIYGRYLFIALGFFVFWLIWDYINNVKNKNVIKALFIVLAINFFGNIFILKDQFKDGIVNVHSLTLPTILMKEDIKYQDIKK